MRWLDQRIDSFIRWVRDHPDTVTLPIGPNTDDPTTMRYFVWKRNPYFNCYLHNFRHSDEEHLHDHRMFNISIVLEGGYAEELFCSNPAHKTKLPRIYIRPIRRLRPRFRFAGTPHRVTMYKDDQGNDKQCWSLFFGFKHVRNWGFWCPGDGYSTKWVPFEQYTSSVDPLHPDYGKVGKGCGE